ncbi:MAG: sodium:solute symporter [Burkholderiaceae bacterium]|jgi:SSS family solute:Na+ symporter
MDIVAIVVFVFFFVLVTLLGFFAARWRRGDLNSLHEWGLAGRRFGTVVSWFLVGGDLYTAYTFIAVPAAVFGAGAVGFFAVPYTILIYPFGFLVLPRLWAVSKRHGYITPADFVRGRYDSPTLALAIAATGIIATMPYIALQLVGIQVVIAALGFPTEGFVGEIPLVISFVILAAYTYTSGLRAPALIAVVKDTLIYITIIAAMIVIPAKLGGFSAIFAKIPADKLLLKAPSGDNLNAFSAYTTLALGSAFALFLYPHSVTAILSSRGGNTIRRNMLLLPAYSLLLGLLALLGFMAYAAGVDKMPQFAAYFATYKAQFAVPGLFLAMFPSWFVGLAFAAIAIGALVPAAIMSIAASNLFTRNIYREYLRPNCTPEQETRVAKLVSLIVKIGALVFIVGVPQQYAIQLQLLGGIWIIQTLPAVFLGLYTRALDHRALLLGWLAGIAFGSWVAYQNSFKNANFALEVFGYTIPGYAALYALVLNLGVACVVSLLFQLAGMRTARDLTQRGDYEDVPEAIA